ncbi:carbonic anhydrase [Xylogone sp. PMI_703]|nr:carbonic anhydrase [Xylogone sp. PMI_703]
MAPTPTIADLLERNRSLTCNDRRCIPERFFDIKPGEVVVHRNAGGNIRHALRDIIILDKVLGLKEIAIVHHTDCGTLRFTDDDLRESLKATVDAGHWAEIDAMDFGAITDVEQSVRDNLEWLKKTPFVRKELLQNTYGFIYDVKTGKVERVS